MKLNAQDLPTVQAHYAELPYPPRDPAKELEYLFEPNSSYLGNIIHYCHGGHEPDWNTFRVLDAGGGTGDATIYLAHQLKHTAAQIVYLDFSPHSKAIAMARAEKRGLTNIHFVEGSILDADTLGLGHFDLIISSGVLHHLKDPQSGLAALRRTMKEKAFLGLMLYATHGRFPIYQLQEMFRRVLPQDMPVNEKVALARHMLNNLPETHPFRQPLYQKMFASEILTDAGLYDLLLHAQDRPYTILETYDFLHNANLHMIEPPGIDAAGIQYLQGEGANPPATLKKLLAALPARDRFAVGELFHGSNMRQMCYAATQAGPKTAVPGPEMIPYMYTQHDKQMQQLENLLTTHPGQSLTISSEVGKFTLIPTPHLEKVVKVMDGNRTMGQMALLLHNKYKIPLAEAKTAVEKAYNTLESTGHIRLRHASTRWTPQA